MEELKKILADEQRRCIEALSYRAPFEDGYKNIVESLRFITLMLTEEVIKERNQPVAAAPDTPPAVEPTVEPPLVEVPKDEPAPIEMPSGDDIPFEPMSFDEFRAAAIKASESMSIRPFLEKYCPKGGQIKLSAVPEESRAAMVEELKAAVKEA